MTIQAGDRLPDATFFRIGDGVESFQAQEYFAGRKVVVFGLPGAFTPTCSAQHMPGYVARADEFFAKGVDAIACLSVNDAWVMKAWANDQGAIGKIDMLADGNAEFTKAIGLDADMSARGYGVRCRRFAMVVNDGVVQNIAIEEQPVLKVSAADHMLEAV
jgi:peroxiredoxin